MAEIKVTVKRASDDGRVVLQVEAFGESVTSVLLSVGDSVVVPVVIS